MLNRMVHRHSVPYPELSKAFKSLFNARAQNPFKQNFYPGLTNL